MEREPISEQESKRIQEDLFKAKKSYLCKWCNHHKNMHVKDYYYADGGNPLSAVQEEICLSGGEGCFCGGFKEK